LQKVPLSRRTLIGACAAAPAAAIPASADAQAGATLSPKMEELVRRNYAAWEAKDWPRLDSLLADDFTFSSAAPDDHISKAAFKTQCWDTQSPLIGAFDLLHVYGSGDEAFALYVCRTRNGKTFRNVEYLRARNGKLVAIECYFGGAGYPSAADSQH